MLPVALIVKIATDAAVIITHFHNKSSFGDAFYDVIRCEKMCFLPRVSEVHGSLVFGAGYLLNNTLFAQKTTLNL